MSGGAASVAIPADVTASYADFKQRRKFRWMTLRLDTERFELSVDRTGAPGSTVDDFVRALPDGEPRYAIYDLVIKNNYGGTNTRLYLFTWTPATAGRNNLAYASSRKGLDAFFSGVESKQATSRKDIVDVLSPAPAPAARKGGKAAAGAGDDDDAFDPDA